MFVRDLIILPVSRVELEGVGGVWSGIGKTIAFAIRSVDRSVVKEGNDFFVWFSFNQMFVRVLIILPLNKGGARGGRWRMVGNWEDYRLRYSLS